MPILRREILNQVFAPRRVLLTRLVLYYLPRIRELTRPWASANYALSRLRNQGRIVPELVNGTNWYHLPNVASTKLEDARRNKVPVHDSWLRAQGRGGKHAEALWRKAFADAKWLVDLTSRRIVCPIRDDPDAPHTDDHEIDVYADKLPERLIIGAEVKHGFSEGWIDPDVVIDWKLTESMRALRHHFKAMTAVNVRPILLAPFVDPSFYVFQNKHRGLHARYLYSIFHPADARLAESVREHFKIGHVWAKAEPPANFHAFVARVPSLLANQ